MLSAAEIARGVQGALGFLQRDRAAPMHFENTMEGCLRSFQVMLLALPLYALYLGIYYAGVTYTGDETDIALAEGLRYSFSTRTLAANMLLAGFYGTFAYNWALVLPLLARFALDSGAEGFGTLNAAMGIGLTLVGHTE